MLGMSKFYCQWAGFGGRGDYGGRFYRRRVRFGWKTAGAGNNFYRGGPWGVGAGTDGKLWRIDFTMCQFVLYKCLILQFTIFHFFQFFFQVWVEMELGEALFSVREWKLWNLWQDFLDNFENISFVLHKFILSWDHFWGLRNRQARSIFGTPCHFYYCS